jgi:type IV pilus assembly protein PilX
VSKRSPSVSSRQSGAALITSLLLLLVLTVLGLVMMQTSRMQERMAGNTRDQNLALQGAEAGLRYGEAVIAAAPVAPFASAAPCLVCQQGALPIAMYDLSQFNWLTDLSSQTYGHTVGAVQTDLTQANGVGLKANPKYTVEYVNRVRDNLLPDSNAVNYYQVTSYSTGASGSANVVVQSTFGRRE